MDVPLQAIVRLADVFTSTAADVKTLTETLERSSAIFQLMDDILAEQEESLRTLEAAIFRTSTF